MLPPDKDTGTRLPSTITTQQCPQEITAGERTSIGLTVTNVSSAPWERDMPGGRHICIANHWLTAGGETCVADDGRARLPHDLAPGQTGEAVLEVTAWESPGTYLLQIDLVQEKICWFAQRGSVTARVPVRVVARTSPKPIPVDAPARPEGLLARIRRKLRGPAPAFEMHVVPRNLIEETVANAGGTIIAAIDDNAADAGWLSYTYICRKN